VWDKALTQGQRETGHHREAPDLTIPREALCAPRLHAAPGKLGSLARQLGAEPRLRPAGAQEGALKACPGTRLEHLMSRKGGAGSEEKAGRLAAWGSGQATREQARHTPSVWTSRQHTGDHDRQTDMHGICQALEGRYQDPTARCARAHARTHTHTSAHKPDRHPGGTRERMAQQQGRSTRAVR